jgi:drug/metabolite transporter (DMT)-like permease
MIALLCGVAASICFALSALCASASSREIGAARTLAWAMTIGLALVLPGVLIAGTGHLSSRRIALLAVLGLTNVAGLLVEYVAFRRGKIGVVAPVVSTEGAVATLIAVIAGASISGGTALLLIVVSIGVVLATARSGSPDATRRTTGTRSAFLAIPAAILFGINLYITGRLGSQLSVAWVLLPARLIGCICLAAPLAARGRLRAPRSALPLVAGVGVGEVVGILSYTLGARHNLAVAAVLASQFAAVAAVGGYIFFDERLSRSQLAGLIVIALGVGLLAVVSA